MRTFNRVLAALVALALLAAALAIAVEIPLGAARGHSTILPWDRWYESARANAWSSRSIRTFLGIVLAVGLVLLLLQLVRRRPAALALHSSREGVDVVLQRPSLEHALRRAAGGVDGVSAVTVAVDESRVRARARTNRRVLGDTEIQVRHALEDVLARYPFARTPRVDVRVQRTKAAESAVAGRQEQ
jgi:hypothetical protein